MSSVADVRVETIENGWNLHQAGKTFGALTMGQATKLFHQLLSEQSAVSGQPSGDEGMEDLLTLQDVERVLKVSPRTVRRLAETGALPTVHIGRLRRVWAEDLRAYVVSHQAVAS
jgi:excisionase family DNA binding protein